MKSLPVLLFAAVFLLVGVWFALRKPPVDSPPSSHSAQAAIQSQTAAIPAPAPTPPLSAQGNPEALLDLDKVSLMLRDYRTLARENPVGTNAEIMRALMGGNPRQATFGPPEGQRLNSQGELLDRWGTPYFFHQLSGTKMEIRSAGPDRKMWNQDDLVQP